ncbi:hypothetical protein ACFIOY_39325 [Bradyrhizobium sp. TZ2]
MTEPDYDARRFASADFGLLGLRSFRCGALGTIDALMAVRCAPKPECCLFVAATSAFLLGITQNENDAESDLANL